MAIKPNNSGDHRTGFLPLSGDHFTANNVTVGQLIQFAYRVQDFQILAGPTWTKDKRFDIEAKVPPDTSTDDIPSMLRSSLIERFNLRVRVEQESLPAYSLGVADSGTKLRDSEPCTTPSPSNPCSGAALQPEGLLIGRAVGIQQIVGILSYLLSRPVVDDTHLTGKYDFDLRWKPDSLTTLLDQGTHDHTESDNPDLFTALQQQLGLKLRNTKAPATILRIDRVEQPTEN